jgi:transposase-like protein
MWETRVGEIDLLVPRNRSGTVYFLCFLKARRPAGQAIVAVVMEAYVNGVSTRKVDRFVEQLGIGAMTQDLMKTCDTSAGKLRLGAYAPPALLSESGG